jgi:hypothetical protein
LEATGHQKLRILNPCPQLKIEHVQIGNEDFKDVLLKSWKQLVSHGKAYRQKGNGTKEQRK